MHYLLTFPLILGLTSCSCYDVPLEPAHEKNIDVSIGVVITAKKEMIGMLVEHIDDGHKYVSIAALPGYANRYVLKRIRVAAGTSFQIVGFTGPRSPLCSYASAVLKTATKLDDSSEEARVNLVKMPNGVWSVDGEMFSVRESIGSQEEERIFHNQSSSSIGK